MDVELLDTCEHHEVRERCVPCMRAQGADAIAEERAEYAQQAGIFTSGYEEGYLDALDIAEQIARRGTR